MNRAFVLAALALGVLGVYFFVTAPPPLPEKGAAAGKKVPVDMMLQLVADENAAVRKLYTEDIVGAGLKAGLKFNEQWKQPTEEAGPLPALFLRGVASRLDRSGTGLGLFLGSDFPISGANKFAGDQTERYALLKRENKPQFFRDAGTHRYTAMFPDPAVAQACVTCHNQHPSSPKRDWKLNDTMGATTWLYPSGELSVDEVLKIIATLRGAVKETYAEYLDKAQKFATDRPQVGDRWPRDGRFLPSVDVFMRTVEERASATTVASLLAMSEKDHETAR